MACVLVAVLSSVTNVRSLQQESSNEVCAVKFTSGNAAILDACEARCAGTSAVTTSFGAVNKGISPESFDQLCSDPGNSTVDCSADKIGHIRNALYEIVGEDGRPLMEKIAQTKSAIAGEVSDLNGQYRGKFLDLMTEFPGFTNQQVVTRPAELVTEFEGAFDNLPSVAALVPLLQDLNSKLQTTYIPRITALAAGLDHQLQTCNRMVNVLPPKQMCKRGADDPDVNLCCCRSNGLASSAENVPDFCAGSNHGNSDDKKPCFPSDAKVTLSNGTSIRIDKLKERDSIMAATANGMVSIDDVSVLSIADARHNDILFLKFTTATGFNVTVTAEHHLSTGKLCCSTLRQAKNVRIGDTLYTVKEGAVVAERVVMISKVVKQGLYSPVLVNGNFPIVDGIVTSFDSSMVVRIMGTLSPYGLSLLDVTGTTNVFRRTFLEHDRKYIDGFHSV